MREFFAVLSARLRALFGLRRIENDVADEIAFHVDLARDELLRSGMTRDEAEIAVRRRFGNRTRLSERCREQWLGQSLEYLLRDCAYALRVFRKAPATTALVLAVLAFGIAVSTTMFAIFDAVLIKPLPFEDSDHLVLLTESVGSDGRTYAGLPVNSGNYALWAQQSQLMSGIALLDSSSDNLYTESGSVRINGMRTTSPLFRILGVRPYLGRFFTSEDDRYGHALSVILTYPFWQSQFGGDPAIVGRTIRLNGYPNTVVGVLPPSFYFPSNSELYTGGSNSNERKLEYFLNYALRPDELKPGLEEFNYPAIGKVRPGISLKVANAELDAIERQVPHDAQTRLHVEFTPLKEFIVGPAERNIKFCVAGALLLLVLVCINAAGVLLSRGLRRAQEIAIRVSLGASRQDLIRQFAAEGFMLSLISGMFGMLGSLAALKALTVAAPLSLPRVQTIQPDYVSCVTCVAVSLAAGLLVCLMPALRLLRTGSAEVLKAAGPNASATRSRLLLQRTFTVAEVALCAVLLALACMVAKSFLSVLNANRLLRQNAVLTTEVLPPPNPYNDEGQRRNLISRLVAEATEIPGVTAAGLSSALPATGETWVSSVPFREYPSPSHQKISANIRFTTPDYLRALGLPLVRGRFIEETDFNNEVALISRAVADQLPHDLNPIGTHLEMWSQTAKDHKVWLTVVGVVEDVRAHPDQPAPATVYVPYWHWAPWTCTLVVRTSDGRAVEVAEGLRKTIRRVDSRLALSQIRSMSSVLSDALAPRRYVSELSGLFALSATFLAVLGVYGLTALTAAQRTREIGIRVALGAEGQQIFRMLISDSVLLAALGVAIGAALTVPARRLIGSLLYEPGSKEPLLVFAVAAVLIVTAALASMGPALRALRVDPVSALKYE